VSLLVARLFEFIFTVPFEKIVPFEIGQIGVEDGEATRNPLERLETPTERNWCPALRWRGIGEQPSSGLGVIFLCSMEHRLHRAPGMMPQSEKARPPRKRYPRNQLEAAGLGTAIWFTVTNITYGEPVEVNDGSTAGVPKRICRAVTP
jgi:hypothetical protein